MDNRVFNVNGEKREELNLAIKLAFLQSGPNTKANFWKITPKNGLILYCYSSSSAQTTAFPMPLSDSSAATLAWDWLNSDESKNFDFPKTGWFADNDHDGSNSLGWRVYCEDWGNVNGDYGVICAIHPAFLWHGK